MDRASLSARNKNIGMLIQEDNKATNALSKLGKTAEQLAIAVRRITRTWKGVREEDTVRLAQALIISRITYSLLFHQMDHKQEERVDAIITTAHKTALGIYTSNEKFLKLGVHNTFREIKNRLLDA